MDRQSTTSKTSRSDVEQITLGIADVRKLVNGGAVHKVTANATRGKDVSLSGRAMRRIREVWNLLEREESND